MDTLRVYTVTLLGVVNSTCVVLENIHTYPAYFFWFETSLQPSGNSSLTSLFPLKSLAF